MTYFSDVCVLFYRCRLFRRGKLGVRRQREQLGAAIAAEIRTDGSPQKQDALLTTATHSAHSIWHKL